MKTRILATLGALALATSAMAADLPRKTAPVAPFAKAAPLFTWTGFYAGLNAGYGFGKFTGSAAPNFKDPKGFIGGGQVGYNYQLGNNIVLGAEADIDWANLEGKQSAAGIAGSKNTINYVGTVRGRVGYAVDRFMPYLTAGFAYGGSTVTVPTVGKTSPVHYGWAAGGGIEYAITNNLTARVEGLYVDLGNEKVLSNTRKSGAEVGIIRAGVNYKF